MDLKALLEGLISTINELQAKLADVPLALEAVAKENYDKGFVDGVASVQPPVSDKIYSQEELDAVVLPLTDKISVLQIQVDEIPALIDAKIAEFKANLLVKYQEQQESESQSEEMIKDLLK